MTACLNRTTIDSGLCGKPARVEMYTGTPGVPHPLCAECQLECIERLKRKILDLESKAEIEKKWLTWAIFAKRIDKPIS